MPGDEVELNFELFTRLAPLVAPLNVNFKVDVRWFYAPFRLLYRDFNEMFMGNSTSDAYLMPQIAFPTNADFQTFYKNYGRLYQSFGLPQSDGIYSIAPSSKPARLPLAPLRMYNQIFYHYYLDSRKFSQTELDIIRAKLVVNTSVSMGIAELYELEHLEAIRKEMGSLAFEGLYQQKPVIQDGFYIKDGWIQRYDIPPKVIEDSIITFDLTFKGDEQSDWVVAVS